MTFYNHNIKQVSSSLWTSIVSPKRESISLQIEIKSFYNPQQRTKSVSCGWNRFSINKTHSRHWTKHLLLNFLPVGLVLTIHGLASGRVENNNESSEQGEEDHSRYWSLPPAPAERVREERERECRSKPPPPLHPVADWCWWRVL